MIGSAMLLAGLGFGLVLIGRDHTLDSAKTKLTAAKSSVEDLTSQAESSANSAGTDPAAAARAKATGTDATSLLNDMGGILQEFTIDLRFPVFCILVGAALMSVATIEFGGHGIFSA